MATLQETSALLIDLDGVIYQGDHLIPGGDEAIKWIARNNIPHRFVTNTSSSPRSIILEKLHSLGVPAKITDILTPPVVASKWLAEQATGPVALIVPDVTKTEFYDIEQLDENAESGACAVVIGDLGTGWTFSELNRAFRLLLDNSNPELVALGMTRYWRTEDGLQLDVGPFVKALEYAAGCNAVVLGKPSPQFFEESLLDLGCPAASTLMIGDDIVGDVQAAQNAGLYGALVKTGKFRPEDLEKERHPDLVLESIADLPAWWEAKRKLDQDSAIQR
jgi:HAD superfamily hydrolase (TIGR01458 family)